MNIKNVGNGKVVLLSGGGKIFTDIAARFCRSEKTLDEICNTPYCANLVKTIIDSGHKAATEFDYFIFGIEGYSRVTEVQLVRKRLASYLIKSGRCEKGGKRSFDVVLPENIMNHKIILSARNDDDELVVIKLTTSEILNILEMWYNEGIEIGFPEEDLRYMKPQATEMKAIIGMNVHALMDWFQIRCCMNAQHEIRDLANKMLNLCKEVAPDLFENAGANCKVLGYCPENTLQNKMCMNKIFTKNEMQEILKMKRKEEQRYEQKLEESKRFLKI